MPKQKAPGVLIAIGLIFVCVSLLSMGIGVYQVRRQARMLSTFLPISAKVVSSRITLQSGNKGRTVYAPDIRFTFEVDGRRESSATPFINYQSASYAWAQDLVRRFPPGAAVTAWHSPTERNQAFLIHEADFTIYGFILFPMLHFSLGLMMLLSGLGLGSKSEIGLLLVIPACLWDTVGALAFAHFMYIGGRWSVAPMVTFAIYGGMGALVSVYSIWNILRRSTVPRSH